MAVTWFFSSWCHLESCLKHGRHPSQFQSDGLRAAEDPFRIRAAERTREGGRSYHASLMQGRWCALDLTEWQLGFSRKWRRSSKPASCTYIYFRMDPFPFRRLGLILKLKSNICTLKTTYILLICVTLRWAVQSDTVHKPCGIHCNYLSMVIDCNRLSFFL